jgi:hypothetical protein
MLDVMVQHPLCTEQFEGLSYGDCGVSFVMSALSFVSFKVIAEYVLVNLFIGMILEEFIKAEGDRLELYIVHGPLSSSFRGPKARLPDRRNMVCMSTPRRCGSSPRRKSVIGTRSSDGFQDLKSVNGSRRASVATGNVTSRSVAPVHDLSCLQCWNRYTGGGKNDFILISDVQMMMRGLPQPLGFSRNMYGEPVPTSRDRSVCKLIRAELNLIAVSRPERKQGVWHRLWDRLGHLLGVHVPQPPTTQHVSYDEVCAFNWELRAQNSCICQVHVCAKIV